MMSIIRLLAWAPKAKPPSPLSFDRYMPILLFLEKCSPRSLAVLKHGKFIQLLLGINTLPKTQVIYLQALYLHLINWQGHDILTTG
jgi:hypothetical protein